MAADAPLIGVLALQGGFEAHARMLRGLGADVREVRTPADLQGLDGLVIPGGESTTMTLGIEREGLAGPLRELLAETGIPAAGRCHPASVETGIPAAGRCHPASVETGIPAAGRCHPASVAPLDGGGVPVLGSCAGLIMLDRDHLALMDIVARRNAFGRQIHSFEAHLTIRGIDGPPLRGVFIRAPWIAQHGPDVEILAELDGHPVAARQNNMLAVAFHAELTDDARLHRLFLEVVAAARLRSPAKSAALPAGPARG